MASKRQQTSATFSASPGMNWREKVSNQGSGETGLDDDPHRPQVRFPPLRDGSASTPFRVPWLRGGGLRHGVVFHS